MCVWSKLIYQDLCKIMDTITPQWWFIVQKNASIIKISLLQMSINQTRYLSYSNIYFKSLLIDWCKKVVIFKIYTHTHTKKNIYTHCQIYLRCGYIVTLLNLFFKELTHTHPHSSSSLNFTVRSFWLLCNQKLILSVYETSSFLINVLTWQKFYFILFLPLITTYSFKTYFSIPNDCGKNLQIYILLKLDYFIYLSYTH